MDQDGETIEAELTELEGVGSKIAASVRKFFGEEHNRRVVFRLIEAGVDPVEPDVEVGSSLTGRTFCITGTLSVPRRNIKERIMAAAGKVVGSVSSATSYLVVGTSPGSKLRRAQKLGVSILSEQDLDTLLSGGDAPDSGADGETENQDDGRTRFRLTPPDDVES